MPLRPVVFAIALLFAGCDSKSPESNAGTVTPKVSTFPTVTTTKSSIEPEPSKGPAGIGKPVTVGHIRVTIKAARIGKVPLKQTDGSIEYSPEARLMLTVRIENISDKRQSPYNTWVPDLDTAKTFAKLTNDAGNELKRITFGFGNNVKDRTVLDTLSPGKVISDLLVFEAPSLKAAHLDLELPGANCGVKGEFHFRIEAKAIAR